MNSEKKLTELDIYIISMIVLNYSKNMYQQRQNLRISYLQFIMNIQHQSHEINKTIKVNKKKRKANKSLIFQSLADLPKIYGSKNLISNKSPQQRKFTSMRKSETLVPEVKFIFTITPNKKSISHLPKKSKEKKLMLEQSNHKVNFSKNYQKQMGPIPMYSGSQDEKVVCYKSKNLKPFMKRRLNHTVIEKINDQNYDQKTHQNSQSNIKKFQTDHSVIEQQNTGQNQQQIWDSSNGLTPINRSKASFNNNISVKSNTKSTIKRKNRGNRQKINLTAMNILLQRHKIDTVQSKFQNLIIKDTLNFNSLSQQVKHEGILNFKLQELLIKYIEPPTQFQKKSDVLINSSLKQLVRKCLRSQLFKIKIPANDDQVKNWIKNYKFNNPQLNELQRKEVAFIPYKNNKAIYYGEVFQKKRHGLGVYICQNHVFQGQFLNDKKIMGYQINSQGIYKGYFDDNKRNGKGQYHWYNGEYFIGNWWNNLKHGKGYWQKPTGQYYDGEWNENKINGFGRYNYSKNHYYEGNFLNFMKNGKGTQYFDNGQWYTGEYMYGVAQGQGTYFWSKEEYYQGNFKDQSRHGKGKYVKSNQWEYLGNYQNDKRQGRGLLKIKQQIILSGQFKCNQFVKGVQQIKSNGQIKEFKVQEQQKLQSIKN